MRYDDFRRSDDIDDRRDDSGGGGGGGGFGLPMGGGGLGIGTIIILGLVGYAFGIDPRILIGGAEILTGGDKAPTYQTDRQSGPAKTGAPKDEVGSMIAGILGEIDDRWSGDLPGVRPAITPGRASCCSATPPMADAAAWRSRRWGRSTAAGQADLPRHRFLPRGRDALSRLLGQRLQVHAAYIIAHEAGHHIQNLLGILPRVQRLQQQAGSKAEANALQVKVELQADCLSGVWVNREAKKRPGFLEEGDIDAALRTASAIGDDTLQRQATGRVVPDSFTHGSAAQRKQWFMTGFQQGTVQACNTFAQGAL